MFTHVFYLIFELGVAVITLIAVGTIITKAGYSSGWILVPLAPVIVNIGTLIYVSSAVRSSALHGVFPTGGMRTVLDLFLIDLLLLAGVWIFFLIFAFRPWPALEAQASQGRSNYSPSAVNPRGVPQPGVGSPSSLGRTPVRPTVSASGAPDTRRRIYCPWCGEHIPGNRALGHDCGPRDRPEVICRYCGQAFAEGTMICSRCDA
jgi:hypothetical protein